MKEQNKRTLKNVFLSLIKNDAAIEGAKTAPWWIAIIMFVLGTFLPVIPIMVNASKSYGAQFISGNVYGFEQAITVAATELKDNNHALRLENNELIHYYNDEKQTTTWYPKDGEEKPFDETPIAIYEAEYYGFKTKPFSIYYSDRPWSGGEKNIKSLIVEIEKLKYVNNMEEIYDPNLHDVNPKTDLYTPSYIIFFKTGMYSKIYKNNSTAVGSVSYTGMNWKNSSFKNNDLLEEILTVEGMTPNARDINYTQAVLNNCKKVFNDSYLTQKWNTFWFNSGLYFGIYLVLGAFMGLMMFLLTRGKNNPNRGLNFWITFKISCWIDITPGILAMILGFVWSAAAGLGYIVLIGLRTMWLSMRQLNPTAQQQ